MLPSGGCKLVHAIVVSLDKLSSSWISVDVTCGTGLSSRLLTNIDFASSIFSIFSRPRINSNLVSDVTI